MAWALWTGPIPVAVEFYFGDFLLLGRRITPS